MSLKFDEMVSNTNQTANITIIILKEDNTQIESGFVAAFYNDDIRTPNGGNPIQLNGFTGNYIIQIGRASCRERV